jgi:prepilin-type N-terminal cleavage/methylation domain-containing protein
MKTKGFTLVELLISLAMLGVISVALFQTLGTSIQSTGALNASNDLLKEGQIAQQVLYARLKEACHLYPSGTNLSLGLVTNDATNNSWNATPQQWTVNTHPIVAMILPPPAVAESDGTTTGRFFRFYAYYAMTREDFIATTTIPSSAKPTGDVRNDPTAWVIMQYRVNLTFAPGTTTPCATMATTATITGGVSSLLVDYVAPANPITGLFSVGANWVDYNLQLEQRTVSGNTIRVGQSAGNSNLRGRIYPQNLNL